MYSLVCGAPRRAASSFSLGFAVSRLAIIVEDSIGRDTSVETSIGGRGLITPKSIIRITIHMSTDMLWSIVFIVLIVFLTRLLPVVV